MSDVSKRKCKDELQALRPHCKHLHGLGWQGYVTKYVTNSFLPGVEEYLPVAWLEQADENFHRRTFARSVWPEIAKHLPLLNPKADVVDGD